MRLEVVEKYRRCELEDQLKELRKEEADRDRERDREGERLRMRRGWKGIKKKKEGITSVGRQRHKQRQWLTLKV